VDQSFDPSSTTASRPLLLRFGLLEKIMSRLSEIYGTVLIEIEILQSKLESTKSDPQLRGRPSKEAGACPRVRTVNINDLVWTGKLGFKTASSDSSSFHGSGSPRASVLHL